MLMFGSAFAMLMPPSSQTQRSTTYRTFSRLSSVDDDPFSITSRVLGGPEQHQKSLPFKHVQQTKPGDNQ
jgi:hypothetical protein